MRGAAQALAQGCTMGCTTNCGLLEDASLELKFAGSDVVESFCNSRLMVVLPGGDLVLDESRQIPFPILRR